MAAGIEVRHRKSCSKPRSDGRCCGASYRASVWSQRDGKRIRKVFPTRAAAVLWRQDAAVALRKGILRPTKAVRLQEAADEWLDAARAGMVMNRSGDPYKPSAIRSYERSLRLRVLPQFGGLKLADLRALDLQDFVDELVAAGSSPSTVTSTLNPLRAIYKRATVRGEVGVNPTRGLTLPAIRTRRERIAGPDELGKLLEALPGDRCLWATAAYAGLRRGELMALRWERVDLASGLIHVERSWDDVVGSVDAKSKAGRRKVPIPAVLRDHLDEHRLQGGGGGLVFGRTIDEPFRPHAVTKAADDAWEAAGLERITLHECRHTYASLMIAAGVNAKALSTYMGHANIAITLDRYGHLMPGSEHEAASLLDEYLDDAQAARNGLPRAEHSLQDHGAISDAQAVR